jgi:hypothetical protein
VQLLRVSVADIGDRLAALVGEVGMDAVSPDLADADHLVVRVAGTADDAGVLGDEVVGLAVGVQAAFSTQPPCPRRPAGTGRRSGSGCGPSPAGSGDSTAPLLAVGAVVCVVQHWA